MTGGKVLLSNDGTNYTESAFAASKAWTLASGDGPKTVYAKFKDAMGNVTATAVTDTIILDTTPPTGTIGINGGAAYTKSHRGHPQPDGHGRWQRQRPGSGALQQQHRLQHLRLGDLCHDGCLDPRLAERRRPSTVYAQFKDKRGR